MHFQKQDLEGTHYNWPAGEKLRFVRQPDRRAFDRNNGAQVLFLINFYGSISERNTLSEGRFIEKKISRELPASAVCEISVFNWMRNTVFSGTRKPIITN